GSPAASIFTHRHTAASASAVRSGSRWRSASGSIRTSSPSRVGGWSKTSRIAIADAQDSRRTGAGLYTRSMTAADHATPPSPVSGRFAPSPSGPMHLGNARTALLAWLDVRARGARRLLRVEDLDRDRCRPQWVDLMRDDLRWLGLDWDEETQPQSLRDPAYDAALDRLQQQGLVYPCFCSRRELAVASAPHGPADAPYPGTCRTLTDGERAERIAEGRRPALRVALPDRALSITDRLCGVVSQQLAADVGDIIVRRSDGLYAY